jgi:hypothetical protein
MYFQSCDDLFLVKGEKLLGECRGISARALPPLPPIQNLLVDPRSGGGRVGGTVVRREQGRNMWGKAFLHTLITHTHSCRSYSSHQAILYIDGF